MNRLKELRTERNMNQAELAELLHVKAATVSRYEKGDRDLDTETVRWLVGFFGCTSDYLLGLSSTRTPALSEAESAMLAAYRAADAHTRELVDLALQPFIEENKNTAAG